MRPIPKQYLPHTAMLFTVTTDAWQHTTDTLVGTLRSVRIEPSHKIVITKDNTEAQLKATLFYDVVSSSGGDTIADGMIVLFEGVRYLVASVSCLYDDRKLHHLEVGLL